MSMYNCHLIKFYLLSSVNYTKTACLNCSHINLTIFSVSSIIMFQCWCYVGLMLKSGFLCSCRYICVCVCKMLYRQIINRLTFFCNCTYPTGPTEPARLLGDDATALWFSAGPLCVCVCVFLCVCVFGCVCVCLGVVCVCVCVCVCLCVCMVCRYVTVTS